MVSDDSVRICSDVFVSFRKRLKANVLGEYFYFFSKIIVLPLHQKTKPGAKEHSSKYHNIIEE